MQYSVPLAFARSLLASLHRDSTVLHCQISCSLFLYYPSFLILYFIQVFMYMIIMMLFVFDLQS